MYLRRINVNLYQDIKVLTHYCSTIGKPISGLDILSRVILSHALEATSLITERSSVILSHALEATSLITERQRRICYRSFTPLRSVQDDRGSAVPFRMTGVAQFRSG